MTKRIYFGYNEIDGKFYVNETGRAIEPGSLIFDSFNGAIKYMEQVWPRRQLEVLFQKNLEKKCMEAAQALKKAKLRATFHQN